MSNYDPRSLVDRIVGVCLSLLVGAVAVYIAVRLLQAVWVVLLVIVCVGIFLSLAVTLLRRRQRRW